LSWYEPQPKQKPKRLPRRRPIKTIPSGIGDKGIVGNWLFYYLKGGDHLHDFSPEDNHGTINGAKWKDGRYGWALKFDGVDDYVRTSLDVDPTTTSVTVLGWAYPTILPSNKGDNEKFFQQMDGTGTGRTWVFGDPSTDEWNSYIGGSNHPSGISVKKKWQHIAFIWNKADGTCNWVINGNEGDSDTVSMESADGDWLLGIGKKLGGLFEGFLTIARIYLAAKSVSWIKRRYKRTKSIFGL